MAPSEQRSFDIVPKQKDHETLIDKVIAAKGLKPIVVLTQEEYDLLDVPDPDTLYVVIG